MTTVTLRKECNSVPCIAGGTSTSRGRRSRRLASGVVPLILAADAVIIVLAAHVIAHLSISLSPSLSLVHKKQINTYFFTPRTASDTALAASFIT